MLDIEAQQAGNILLNASDTRRSDPGIICLVSLLRFHGVPADPTTLGHQLGAGETASTQDDLIRLARRQGLKARAVRGRRWDNLTKTPLPAIATGNLAGRGSGY